MSAHKDWDGGQGRRWAENLDALEAMMTAAGEAAMDALAAGPEAHALDLGCGGGATSFALAARRPQGRITGLDISGPLLERAEARRQGHADAARLRFVKADAAAWTAEAPHDALFSRCGGMFFGDETAAYANLRAQLRPGAPMAMMVWGPRAECAWGWMAEALLSDLLERLTGAAPAPRDAPVPDAPGPFRWGDIAPRLAMLEAAGWAAPRAEAMEAATPISLGEGDAVTRAVNFAMALSPAAQALAGAGEAERAEARARLAEGFAPHVRGDGAGGEAVALPAAAWLVTAAA